MSTGRPTNPINRRAALAVAIWLAIHLAAISLCVGRFGLWARAPQAVERSGLAILLAFQAAAAALLFPYLLRSISSTLLAVASAWPMAVLASQLSDAPFGTVSGELFITLWLVTLHFWSRLLRSPKSEVMGISLAAIYAIGAPILWYLHQEFGAGGNTTDAAHWRLFGPVAGAISQTITPHFSGPWVELGVIFCCGASISMFIAHRRALPQQVIH
jgi:hypothetical protein